jgi:hypothetical protein
MGTYKLSGQSKKVGSGDAKIAAHKAASGSPGSSQAKTPVDYAPKAEETKESQPTATTITANDGRKLTILSGPVREYPAPYSPAYTQQLEKERLNSGVQPQQVAVSKGSSSQSASPKILSGPVREYPAPYSPDYTQKVEMGKLASGIQPERSAPALRKELIQSETGTTVSYVPGQPTTAERLRQEEQKEGMSAMDLGKYEKPAARYEGGVESALNPLTSSQYKSARFVGGVAEAVAYTPTAIPRLVKGLTTNPAATVRESVLSVPESIIADPARGVGQVAGMVISGKAAGKAMGAAKKAAPSINIASASQDVLVKVRVPEAPKVTTADPLPIKQAEYKGTVFGQDSFKISDVQSQVNPASNPQPSTNVLLGKTKDGFTDVYFKIDKAMALDMSRKYTGNVENIRSPQGSFAVFEPTGIIDSVSFQKSGAARLPKPAEQIGSLPEKSVRPFGVEPSGDLLRIERKVNLQEGALKVSPINQLQLPEFTKTVEAKGKVANDFNIRDFYKSPRFEKPLQLESGLVKQRRNLFADTTAELKPRLQYQEKPTIIGNMPEMQTRYVNVERPLAMKDPLKTDMSQMQKLYDKAAKQGKDPIPTIDSISRVKTTRFPGQSRSPAPIVIPSLLPRGTPSPKGKAEPALSKYSTPIRFHELAAIPKTDFMREPAGRSKTPLSYPVLKDATVVTTSTVPKLLVPKISESRKKRQPKKKSKGSAEWEYDRIANKYNNPFNIKGW